MIKPQDTFLNFEDKWVVVTGASSGIGRAVAGELDRCGANTILIDHNGEGLKETSELMANESKLLLLDLSKLSQIQPRLLEEVKGAGRIYGLCHAAGAVVVRALSSTKPEMAMSLMEINYMAGLEISRVLSRRDVMEKDGGSFLFVSSMYGLVGIPGQIAYCASKGAIISSVRAMAVELAPRKIRANAISPGVVMTTMTEKLFSSLNEDQRRKIEEAHPLGTGSVEDVANAAVFLLSPGSKWITGTNMVVDGGYTAI